MSISEITDKILLNASQDRKNILKGAEVQIQKTEKEAESKLKEQKTEYENETQKILESNKQKVALGAKKEAKKMIEKVRHDAYNKVFELSLQQLRLLNDNEYKKILISFFQTLPQNVNGIIYSPPKRINITEEAAKESRIQCAVKEDDSVKGGFILKAEQFEYNLTFEKLINDTRSNLEIDVVKKIFA